MLLKLSKYCLLISLFSIVIVSTFAIFPFILGKWVFFRACITLSLIFLTIHWALKKDTQKFFEIKKSLIFGAVLIFALAYVVSGFFGVNPLYSFWSNFERGEGGLQIIYYALFFTLLCFLFRTEKDFNLIIKCFLIVSGACVLYGILAALGVNGFIGPSIFNRFYGSLGNADYLGTFMLFPIFYSLYFAFKKDDKKKKFLSWGLAILFLIFLLLSQTRGSFVGLGAGILASLSFLILKLPKGKNKKIAVWSLGGAVFLILLIFIFGQNIKTPFCPSCSRLVNLNIGELKNLPRVWAWQSAIKGWQERPLFGWGPENYSRVFDKFFDNRHYIAGGGGETWFDRAHSVYLDYLSQTGLIGLVTYLGVLISAGIVIFKIAKKDKIFSGLAFGLLIAYAVQGIFLFEVFPIYLSLFLFLAFLNWKSFE